MSDVGCVGQVWEDLTTKHIWLLLGRDPDHYGEWRVFCLTGTSVSWAGDIWFGSHHTRRIA